MRRRNTSSISTYDNHEQKRVLEAAKEVVGVVLVQVALALPIVSF